MNNNCSSAGRGWDLLLLSCVFWPCLCVTSGCRFMRLIASQHVSENNRVAVRPDVPNRGIIYDRRGRVIAENRPAYRLEIIPEKVPGKLPGLEALLDELSTLIVLDENDRKAFHKSRGNYRVFDSVPLKFDLSEREVARFAVNRHRFHGVDVVPYLSRYYPYGECKCEYNKIRNGPTN